MKLIKIFMVLITIMGLSIMFSAEAPAATGAEIVYMEKDLGEGLWQYDFTFSNNTSSTSDLYGVALFMDVSEPITVTGSPLPDYWFGTVWEGQNTTTYLDTMSINSSYYIAPGTSLSGFSFITDQQIAGFDWHAAFNSDSGVSNIAGTAVVVPEPVSTILFITGGAVMAVRKRFRKKRAIA